MTRFADTLVSFGLVVLGLILMATPLAIWVAWSGTVLVIVLATGTAAGVLYCVLVRFEKPASTKGREAPAKAPPEGLPEPVMDELQKLHPFVHHNRQSESPEFHAAMRRVKKRLYGKRE